MVIGREVGHILFSLFLCQTPSPRHSLKGTKKLASLTPLLVWFYFIWFGYFDIGVFVQSNIINFEPYLTQIVQPYINIIIPMIIITMLTIIDAYL